MLLNRVTMTGADNATDIDKMVRLSDYFPFVEWGILFSESSAGKPKYPTADWLGELAAIEKKEPLFRLSAHLCGKWSRDFISGGRLVLDEFPDLFDSFQRIQLNFSINRNKVDVLELSRTIRELGHQYIIQITGDASIALIRSLQCLRLDVVGLHDLSGGKGISQSCWGQPLQPYCGYAGGLGPDNLQDQLGAVSQVAGDVPVWVDMESNIRTDDQFDLDKVQTCLEIAERWM